MADIEHRLAALEDAVRQLLDERAATDREQSPPDHAPASDSERFWAVDELGRQVPEGAVLFAGHLRTDRGPVKWQWGRTSDDLLAADWDASATPLSALGHPVRLRLLHLVLGGTNTTADLAADEELGTTGQLHHHLRALTAAGWLSSAGRGRYEVPPHRVVPLLTIISATLPS
ncbi:ArsR family transcriptional regulator [Mobilicoccus caccae]|uniref:Helix-turn-helix protein n=1 Tax=Mobilicoccus caccae TaxID=1859295 RepID=A0ABQ6IR10_9MICO|nr:ArsR family transcriptional regulator [Mobilicoccus caccae]GMA39164.1 hypothetical protein GCM10025883_12090 [Mobilicoccus caccae]